MTYVPGAWAERPWPRRSSRTIRRPSAISGGSQSYVAPLPDTPCRKTTTGASSGPCTSACSATPSTSISTPGNLPRGEADLAVRLEHGEPHVVERGDLLLARLGRELLARHALAPEVAVEHLAVDHEDDRLALEHRPQPAHAVAEPGREDGEQRDRRDDG